MKQSAILALCCLISVLLLVSCDSDQCGGQKDTRQPETVLISLDASDTMNTIEYIYYPQINKVIPTKTTVFTLNYLYAFNQTEVVFFYKYDTINIADTLILKSVINELQYNDCYYGYGVDYGPVTLLYNTFSRTEINGKKIIATR